MVVAEPTQVADRLVSAVTDAGGRVDSRSERSGSSSPTVDLVLRIPADKLDGVLADAKKLGTVESMSIGHSDVTSQRVDLDARIEALQTSVNRLLQLMGRAGNVADLLAAESSLTQRQAELDSLRAQRATLGNRFVCDDQRRPLDQTDCYPRRFPRRARTWVALVALAVHGVVMAVGFLIPWIPVLAVLVLLRCWCAAGVFGQHRAANWPNPQAKLPAQISLQVSGDLSEGPVYGVATHAGCRP